MSSDYKDDCLIIVLIPTQPIKAKLYKWNDIVRIVMNGFNVHEPEQVFNSLNSMEATFSYYSHS